jgi:hypothetical protein
LLSAIPHPSRINSKTFLFNFLFKDTNIIK